MKGKKTCPSCNGVCGARCKVCPDEECGHKFKIQPKLKKPKQNFIECNWKELKRGDEILIKGGSYYVKRDPKNGVELARYHMGYSGKARVYSVERQGLMCYDNKYESGVFFVVCVKPENKLGIPMESRRHKIFKLKGISPNEKTL